MALFIVVMVFVLGPIGRWAFERLGGTEEAAFALMLAIVALGATFAETLQLKGILGAFLGGLAVNEAVRGSPAKENLEFLGNSLFIPIIFSVTGSLMPGDVSGGSRGAKL